MASEYKLTKALVSSLNFAKSVYENDDFDDITLLEQCVKHICFDFHAETEDGENY